MPLEFETSPAQVASEALGQIGRPPITNLDDTADPVIVQCKQYYVSLLRTMLRDHKWNFAKDRKELAENPATPISGWAHSFTLPADCVRVFTLNGSDKVRWELEGRNLLTDETTALIEYVKWVSDPNLWDGMFHQAFVTFLTVRLAPALNVDKEKASDLFKVFLMQRDDAKAVDGQEQTQEPMQCTELTDDIRDE